MNQSFARKYFATRDPIGGRISQDEKHIDWNTVVGVVGNVRHSSLEKMPVPQIYFPFGRGNPSSAYIAVQSHLSPKVVVHEIRAAVKAIDPNLAVADIHTRGELMSDASARRRFQTFLLMAFAVLALLMALVGLYGLMAYSVSRRTREVGIPAWHGVRSGVLCSYWF